eukprot:scaffold103723_cov63-Phaeocystis_antarctica.AAC.7
MMPRLLRLLATLRLHLTLVIRPVQVRGQRLGLRLARARARHVVELVELLHYAERAQLLRERPLLLGHAEYVERLGPVCAPLVRHPVAEEQRHGLGSARPLYPLAAPGYSLAKGGENGLPQANTDRQFGRKTHSEQQRYKHAQRYGHPRIKQTTGQRPKGKQAQCGGSSPLLPDSPTKAKRQNSGDHLVELPVRILGDGDGLWLGQGPWLVARG